MLKILLLGMTKSTVRLGVENGYFELQCLQDTYRCVHNYKCKWFTVVLQIRWKCDLCGSKLVIYPVKNNEVGY